MMNKDGKLITKDGKVMPDADALAALLSQMKDRGGNLIQGAGILGNVLQATSDISGQAPRVGQSAFGGALSGLQAGMSFGPLGAVLGAAIGGVGGYMSGSKNLEEYLMQSMNEQNANIASKTVQPTMFKPGGVVGQEGIQTEVGEVILLSDVLELVASAADKEHSDMKGNLITDFLPKGSIVFSNKRTFDPNSISDKTLGYGPGHYEEHKTYAPERITIGNRLGDKELTYAEAAKKLKTSIKVTDGKTKDIFDDITDKENKLTRMMYLQELINHQEMGNEKLVEGDVQKFEWGGEIGKGKSDAYYFEVMKKLAELQNTNATELSKGKEDLTDLGKKLRGSIMAQGALSTLFTSLQNPRTTPLIQDNTFIEDAYQQVPLSLIESQVNPIRGSVNSLAQALLSNGVDPSRVPSMLATTQGRALEAEGQLRSRFIQDRINTDRGKYQALRDNLKTNKSNVVAAENATTEGYNQRFAQYGGILSNVLGAGRELTAGKYEASRGLDRSFFENDINLFRTGAEIQGKKLEFDDNMSRLNERLDQLRSESSRLNSQIDRRNMFHTGIGVDEQGYTMMREIPNIMSLMKMLPMRGINLPPIGGVPLPGDLLKKPAPPTNLNYGVPWM